MAELAKNTAVRSNVQNQAVVHAITRIGTMAKKLAVVLNMSRFPMITDFPLTVNVFRSRRFMHSEQRLSVTTLVSSRPVRNVFGCIALMLHKTLILLLILLCSLSLTQLLSLNSKALIAVLNPLSVLLDELFWIFLPDFSSVRLMSALLCRFSAFLFDTCLFCVFC